MVRARQVAAICVVLAIGALGSAVFGYLSMKRAQDAELKAQQTRQMAETARGEAEKLIVYLLDDFYLELEPVGRLDIVAALSKRAIDYYAALPPELRTPETDRNRALALVRYGAALRTQSKLDESGKALAEAVAVLSKLRKEGDRSEATAIGLGLGLTSQARVAGSQNKRADERVFANQAVDVLKPLMASSDPSIPLRRAYGLAMTFLGFSQGQTEEEETAVATLEEARKAYRSIDDLKLNDLPSAVAYAEASAWQMGALQGLGRNARVREVGTEAMKLTSQVLEKRPGNMSALRARALMGESLSATEGFDLHVRKARELSEQEARDWAATVSLDSSNQIAWNNLASARLGVAFWTLGLGDVRGSEEQWRAALAVERNVNESGMIGNTLAIASGYLAMLEADSGDVPATEAALAANRRFTDLAVRGLAAESFGAAYLPEFLGYYGYPTTGIGYGRFGLPLATRDYETLRREARASARRLEQIKNLTPQQELSRNRALEVAYRTSAVASYRLGDYPAADADVQKAQAIRRGLPTRTLAEERDADDQRMLVALIAARLQRYSEAQQIIDPVLKRHRALYERKDNEDVTQRIQFAQALYVSAIAAPGQKLAQVTQAAAIIDALPSQMRRRLSVVYLRGQIAEEQKARH
jgi:tetratricopeptide (TPR) repeat protein